MNKWKGTLIVPIGIVIVLLPFSFFIRWNLFTLLLFWFIIIPALATYLPALVSRSKNHLFESLVGLAIFYALMIFMIYKHYKTDYFQVMIVSGVVNAVVILVINSARKSESEKRRISTFKSDYNE